MTVPVYFAAAPDYREEHLAPALDAVLTPLVADLGGAAGRRFMLKPNLLSYRRPEDVACTHPAVILGCAK
ncbi:MAG: hypothetical protein IJJ28_03055 [Lentisphaeria bacterium]|nr:hypothetical protein [Lentisphaeria bacterium]